MKGIDPIGFTILFTMVVLALYMEFPKLLKLFYKKDNISRVHNEYNNDLDWIRLTSEGETQAIINRRIKEVEEDNRYRELAFTNPNLKTHHVFHGGCLGCKTPEEKGLGTCRRCCYFTFNHDLKDLNSKRLNND